MLTSQLTGSLMGLGPRRLSDHGWVIDIHNSYNLEKPIVSFNRVMCVHLKTCSEELVALEHSSVWWWPVGENG